MTAEPGSGSSPWRWMAILGIVLGVSAISFSVHRWILSEATEEGRPIAEQRAEQRATQERQIARTDTLTSLLGVLEQKLQDEPLDSMLVISAANVAYDLGDVERAERYYRRFIDSIDSENPAPRIDLSYVVFRDGREDEAIGLLEDVIERYPDNQTAMFNMAYMMDQMGRTDEAISWMERCRDTNPDTPLGRQAASILEQQEQTTTN